MGWLFRVLADNESAGSLASALRRRRFGLFLDQVASLPRPVRVLDLGGTLHFWHAMGLSDPGAIELVLLNRHPISVDVPNVRSVVGDATDLSDFADNEFDVVFSSSLIEHLGERAAQERMAREVRRVGRRYFVQTPNRWFPLEPHFLVPGFQFLPLGLRAALMCRFNLGWYRRIPDPAQALAHVRSHRLLDRRELASLFPDARLAGERFCGLVKSWVAIGPATT